LFLTVSKAEFLQNHHSHDKQSLVIIMQDAENLLSQVKLSEAAHIRAGSYSGGMKRRLSVAIALIGDPKLVFLDEPVFPIIAPCLHL
jgi:ABC-type multidrug transport system ATPase subunit